MKVTATSLIAAMYFRKQDIFTYAELDDLRTDLLPKIKQMVVNHAGGSHPWENMNDMELLKSAGLYGKDRITGQSGYNLATVMLLGKYNVIRDVCPAYETDALVRRVNLDRYTAKFVIEKKRMYVENANRAA